MCLPSPHPSATRQGSGAALVVRRSRQLVKSVKLMNKSLTVSLICSAMLASCSSVPQKSASENICSYDRKTMLELSETEFDQDAGGGWRAVASKPGCNLAAADLLRDYRQTRGSESGILYWHEAQVRAFAGQTGDAISLMKQAYKPEDSDHAGWNPYVDATIAFLRNDLDSLKKARATLAAVLPPVGEEIPPVIDGFMEVAMIDGSKRKIQWPPNIDVVDGLVSCFGKAYVLAYACRAAAK